MKPRLAIFTKNRTNPAYAAARSGADRIAQRHGAEATHYVPDVPDDISQQIELIDRDHHAGERVAIALRARELDAQDVLDLRHREQAARRCWPGALGAAGAGTGFAHEFVGSHRRGVRA